MHAAFVLFAVATTALAQTTPECVTRFAGILATQTNPPMAFTLSSANQVAYLGDGLAPLVVQFQHCFNIEPEVSPEILYGRIFVPQHGACISITNQNASVGPYYTTLTPCGANQVPGFAQRFLLKNLSDNGVTDTYWIGAADEEGTIFQGGCGVLSYDSDANGVPIITHSNHQITIVCNPDQTNGPAPFQLTTAVAP